MLLELPCEKKMNLGGYGRWMPLPCLFCNASVLKRRRLNNSKYLIDLKKEAMFINGQ